MTRSEARGAQQEKKLDRLTDPEADYLYSAPF